MSRNIRVSFKSSVALLTGVALGAMAVPALGQVLPPPTYVSGAVSGTITVNFAVAPPSGSTVSCGVSLSSNDARAPSESQSTNAAVTGSTAVCSMTLYYNWPLTTPSSDTLTVTYGVQGPVQYSSAVYAVIPMPPNGFTGGPYNITVNQ